MERLQTQVYSPISVGTLYQQNFHCYNLKDLISASYAITAFLRIYKPHLASNKGFSPIFTHSSIMSPLGFPYCKTQIKSTFFETLVPLNLINEYLRVLLWSSV